MRTASETRTIRVGTDEPFVLGLRQRPGRIGGIVGSSPPSAAVDLQRALGGNFVLLSPRRTVVADWDSCWYDGQYVADPLIFRDLAESSRLNNVSGAFAAAWIENGVLTLCRDAIGERTLFYAQAGETIVFASTLRAILATGLVPFAINAVAIARFLTYAYLPGEETLIDGIREVLPGELVRFGREGVTRESWWNVPADLSGSDEETLRLELRSTLEQSVRRRVIEGEPVGAFLSGGLDSSLVVALARQISPAPLYSYSVSFGEGYANELPFSSMVAEHCGTRHRIVEISPSATVRYLDDSIAELSDPIGDPLTVPNALLFREASREVGVILNGEGGDPCFGGPKNLPMLLSELYGGVMEEEPFSRERSYLRAHQKCFDDLQSMLAPALLERLADHPLEREIEPRMNDRRFPSFVSRLMAINVVFKGAHHILPKVDAEGFPHGVVARSPLFDREIVELAFAIPPQLKLRGSVEKYLLKQAVRDLLPRAILDRPKSGMLVPVEGWFQGPLRSEARERLLDRDTLSGIIRRDYLEQLLCGRLSGPRPRRGIKIWLLITLEAWLRTAREQKCREACEDSRT